VYAYRFSYVAESVSEPGAQHATDIPFFFDTAAIKYGDKTTPRDRAMSRAMSKLPGELRQARRPERRRPAGLAALRARRRRDHGFRDKRQAGSRERSLGKRD
jgi:carboxylesterase type B